MRTFTERINCFDVNGTNPTGFKLERSNTVLTNVSLSTQQNVDNDHANSIKFQPNWVKNDVEHFMTMSKQKVTAKNAIKLFVGDLNLKNFIEIWQLEYVQQ